jgi:O-antigen ligase
VDRYPRTLRGTTGTNFGEVHNDHAQLLAETGLPGYLLFLAAIFAIVRAVRERKTTDARSSIARGIALPLAGTLLVLGLAQFPLYVTITRQLLVTMAGLLIGWSRPWEGMVEESVDESVEEPAA